MRRMEPTTLLMVCAKAVRLASAVPPTATIQAVMVVPILAPNSVAMAVSYVISPCEASVMAMAMVAAECTMAERIVAPAATMATSRSESTSILWNALRIASLLRMGSTPLCMK